MEPTLQETSSPRLCPMCGRSAVGAEQVCPECGDKLPISTRITPAKGIDQAMGVFLALITVLITITVLSPFLLALGFDPVHPNAGSYLCIIMAVIAWLWGPPLIRMKRSEFNPSHRWRVYWQTQVAVYAITLALFLLLFTVCTTASRLNGPSWG